MALPAKAKAWHLDHAHEFRQACVRHTEASVGQVVVYADEAWPAKTPHKANLAAMQEVPMTADAKRILQDLGNLPKFQFFDKIKRSGHLARDRWGVDCSEVHPPPRVMKLVAEPCVPWITPRWMRTATRQISTCRASMPRP